MKTVTHPAAGHAAPAVELARKIALSPMTPDERVAALVEIAGAAAALARLIAKGCHVDPDKLSELVTDPADVKPVLGRGKWLVSMTRHIAAPVKPRRRRAAQTSTQLYLFAGDGA